RGDRPGQRLPRRQVRQDGGPPHPGHDRHARGHAGGPGGGHCLSPAKKPVHEVRPSPPRGEGGDAGPQPPGAEPPARSLAHRLDAVERSLAETSDREREDPSGIPDDRLRLVFTCCHPALAVEARVALTLRTLGGLTTPEIARAFLLPEATLAQRLVRAKRKITE